jgi:GMP synthase (glutamine-hydrolysing)
LKRALAIRHVAFEDLGTMAAILDKCGYRTTCLDAGVDDLTDVEPAEDDLLVVLGGPIGAYQEACYPFLKHELRLIELALKRRSCVLGICLGAQLVALTLGARVYPGRHKEIGIGPISLTSQGYDSCLGKLVPNPYVLHWHGDTFDLPSGAVRLASTDVTPNQAFAYGKKILGLQFHLEAAPQSIERWLIGHSCELTAAGIDIVELRLGLQNQLPDIATKGRAVIKTWIECFEAG